MSVNRNAPLFLSDGTPVEFVKVTSRGNFQVRIPASHALGASDPLRIFKPTTGKHYKNTTDLTLTNTAPAPAVAAPVRGRVDSRQPMFLSDGTPVTLSKTTRRGRIQVVIPAGHPLADGQENGLLFESTTGGRYKDRDPKNIFLTNTASAVAAPVADAAPASTDSDCYVLSVGDSIIEDGFTSFEDAEKAAISALDHDTRSVTILKVTTSVAGVVGIASTRA